MTTTETETEKDLGEMGETASEDKQASSTVVDNQFSEAQSWLKEVSAKVSAKAELRARNMNANKNWPDEMFFCDLDSSLKRNNAFVKRLKMLPTDCEGKEALVKEMELLNLLKYIDEVASALAVDRKFRMNDIPFVVELCSLVHQRYNAFQSSFFSLLKKQFEVKRADEKGGAKSSGSSSSSAVPHQSKMRIDLRYLCELIVAAVLPDKEGISLLNCFLANILNGDASAASTDVISFVISFVTFSGEDFAAIPLKQTLRYSSKYPQLQFPKSSVFSEQIQQGFSKMLADFFERVKTQFVIKERHVVDIVKRNYSILNSKGELHAEKSEEYEAEMAALQKLHQSMCSLADLMNIPPENVPNISVQQLEKQLEAEMEGLDGCGVVVEKWADGIGGAQGNEEETEFDYDRSKWPDSDTKDFYENFPDIVAMLPAAAIRAESLLKKEQNEEDEESSDFVDDVTVGDQESVDVDEEKLDEAVDASNVELEEDEQKDDSSKTTPEGADSAVKQAQGSSSRETKTKAKGSKGSASDALEDALADIGYGDLDAEMAVMSISSSSETPVPTASSTSLTQIQFEKLLARLPECVNREHIDNVSMEFATTQGFNTQANRLKLARTMFMVSRNRLDLLPFYSRMVATIYPCAPEVANQINSDLYREFRGWILKKDQIKIESKIKTVTFIGELTKFGVYKAENTLRILKQLLKTFVHHQIDMTCALLESAGRFLYKSRSSYRLTKILLDEMMRKRSLANLDPRQHAMVENAYYCSNPPPASSLTNVQQERPPVMLAYVQNLVTRELNKNTVDKVLHQTRKLNWEDAQVVSYIRNTFTAVWNVKFSNIQYVASVLAGLVKYHDDVVIQIVDNVLEDIRVGMEVGLLKHNQRRVSVLKFLGELYNYKLLDSTVVFNTLFSLITFGGPLLDPPQNLFRLRLVCTLLDTCGQFFNGGLAKKKLDCFLVYFQRYICAKREWLKLRSMETAKNEQASVEDTQYLKKTLADALRPTNSEGSLPTDVENMISDTMELLRPDFKMELSLEKAEEAVQNLERELKDSYLSQLPEEFQNANSSTAEGSMHDQTLDSSGNHDLYAINEQEEGEDDSTELYGSDCHLRQMMADEDVSGNIISRGSDIQSSHSAFQNEMNDEPDDFLDEFEKFLSENIQQRTAESVRAPSSVDITLPLTARKKMDQSQISATDAIFPTSTGVRDSSTSRGDSNEAALSEGVAVTGASPPMGNISIMLKKGNKVQVKDLNVRVTEEMAENIRQQKLAEDNERKKLIEMTLNISKRQQEEEQLEMVSSIQKSIVSESAKHDKKNSVMVQGYQHTKGAPNVSHIFNQ